MDSGCNSTYIKLFKIRICLSGGECMERIGDTGGMVKHEQYAYCPNVPNRVVIRRYHNDETEEYDFVDLSLNDLHNLINMIESK